MKPAGGRPVADILIVIATLDEYMKKAGLRSLTAVEAAKILDRKGILADSKSRPGMPLRDILRGGRIKHAFQFGGKGSEWVIPISYQPTEQQIGQTPTGKPGTNANEHVDSLSEEIKAVRQTFRPNRVRILFVGESHPANGTFFYYGDSNLFSSTLRAFELGLGQTFDSQKDFLEFFRSSGCYLDDLCSVAVNRIKDDDVRNHHREQSVSWLADRIRSYNPEFVICFMKQIFPYVERAIILSEVDLKKIWSLPFPGRLQHAMAYQEQLSSVVRELLHVE
jgi:hypothetical protein